MSKQTIILKSDALDAYDGNAAALGRALGITRQAVYEWADGPIFEVHALKLRFVLKPEIFNIPGVDNPSISCEANANPNGMVASG